MALGLWALWLHFEGCLVWCGLTHRQPWFKLRLTPGQRDASLGQLLRALEQEAPWAGPRGRERCGKSQARVCRHSICAQPCHQAAVGLWEGLNLTGPVSFTPTEGGGHDQGLLTLLLFQTAETFSQTESKQRSDKSTPKQNFPVKLAFPHLQSGP